MSVPKAKKPLKIAVLGPAGFGGSYLCVELINRGHHVTGISRNPEKVGSHKLYSTLSVNLETSSSDELAEAFKGFDVIIEYLSYNLVLMKRIWPTYPRSGSFSLS
jgi:putative NADH-flavin reductase